MQRVLMCHVLFRNFLTTKNSLKANELPPKPFIEATEAIMKMSPPEVGAICEHWELRVFSWLVVFKRANTINFLQQ